MRPKKASCVSTRSRKLDLKFQQFPIGDRVSGKLDRMTMVSPTGPTAETGSPEIIFAGLIEIDMIQPLQMR